MDFMQRYLLLFFLLWQAQPSFAQTLTVLTEELPPYQYKDETGVPAGYAVDLVKAVLARADLTTAVKIVPWARGYNQALHRKNVILFSMVRTEQREDLFKWIGEVDQLNYFLYKLTSHQALRVNSIAEAKRYRIGVTKLSFEHDKLLELGFSNLTTGVKYANLIEMLHAKRFDLLFASQGPLEDVLKTTRYGVDSLETTYKVKAINQKLYIALSKSSDNELLSKLQNAYRDVVASGEKSRLMARWFDKNI